ncbi:MarR family transcriptional regulator [Vulcanisaeta sp. JCM 16159]|uniref:MarR family transcriptional regulator n=1 Tax=Vulcanisaeta sp. JCM 16159 TaxID=1295371 RepID=UPI0006D222D6|nr:MarR family transcriptional regulator [Vulcanisaeta sp. JCM 16159]
MINRRNEEEETIGVLEELPLSARLILNYLEFEHLINNKTYITFKEIIDGTGLGARTARNAINLLRKRGFVETYLDVKERRRYMYRLNFRNLTQDRVDVSPGLYVIDVGLGTIPSMTFRIYRVLRATAVAFYTDSVPTSYLEFTKCTCAMQRLINYEPQGFEEVVYTVTSNGGSAALVMDALLDSQVVKPYIDAVYESSDHNHVMIYRVVGVSPIQVALELLLMGREDKVSYRRESTIIRIIVTRERLQLKDYIKAYVLAMSDDGLTLKEYDQDHDFNGMKPTLFTQRRK